MRIRRKVLFFERGADDERGRQRWSALLKERAPDDSEEGVLYVVRGPKPQTSSERWICRVPEEPIAVFERGRYQKVVLVYLEELLQDEPLELTFGVNWRQEGSARRARLETKEFACLDDDGEVVRKLYVVDGAARLQPEAGRPYLCSVAGKLSGGERGVYLVNPIRAAGRARDGETAA